MTKLTNDYEIPPQEWLVLNRPQVAGFEPTGDTQNTLQIFRSKSKRSLQPPDGQLKTLTAKNSDTGDQVTTWVERHWGFWSKWKTQEGEHIYSTEKIYPTDDDAAEAWESAKGTLFK